MEEFYAKFVSQKISKTRWRPVPPGSLQTAETFATGSWDNEVPPFPGRGSPASCVFPLSWNRATDGCALILSPSTSPEFLFRARLPYTSEPSMVCLSFESHCVLNYRLYSEDAFRARFLKGNTNVNFREFNVYFISIKFSAWQENYVSLWSIGDLGNLDSDGRFEGDHKLLCGIRHYGDVMDLQVSLLNIQRLITFKKWRVIYIYWCKGP